MKMYIETTTATRRVEKVYKGSATSKKKRQENVMFKNKKRKQLENSQEFNIKKYM